LVLEIHKLFLSPEQHWVTIENLKDILKHIEIHKINISMREKDGGRGREKREGREGEKGGRERSREKEDR
jgi:hypothetical protein